MNYLEQTFPSAAENLAADEALLERTENDGGETLRIWEATEPFVVLGFANRLREEADIVKCERTGLRIRRRVSGGGAVVQGPGCLSYALTFRTSDAGPLSSITGTNRFVMETHRRAIEELIHRPVHVRGHTDLETGGRKFSGNAQRRRRRAVLFHGTILYAADLELFGAALHHPSREPAWRGGRSHGEFLANIPVARDQIIAALRRAWAADEPLTPPPDLSRILVLAERHRDPAWINRLP